MLSCYPIGKTDNVVFTFCLFGFGNMLMAVDPDAYFVFSCSRLSEKGNSKSHSCVFTRETFLWGGGLKCLLVVSLAFVPAQNGYGASRPLQQMHN